MAAARVWARPMAQAYPGIAEQLKGRQNNPKLLQRYVTYDTLPGSQILIRLF
jgi:hypothetical protein